MAELYQKSPERTTDWTEHSIGAEGQQTCSEEDTQDPGWLDDEPQAEPLRKAKLVGQPTCSNDNQNCTALTLPTGQDLRDFPKCEGFPAKCCHEAAINSFVDRFYREELGSKFRKMCQVKEFGDITVETLRALGGPDGFNVEYRYNSAKVSF